MGDYCTEHCLDASYVRGTASLELLPRLRDQLDITHDVIEAAASALSIGN